MRVPGRSIWKPVVQRMVTGRWTRFRMTPTVPPPPTNLARAGLYLHVPFCRNLCPYCPYNRVRHERELFARYERAVREEIDLYAPYLQNTRFVSLYIGGGTPTVDPGGLLRLVKHLQETFSLSCDICIELHPSNMDDACLHSLRDVGVTMLSIGVESTSDRILKAIGRSHDGEEAISALRRARRLGFKSINADLMFALPGQTLSDWDADLRAVLDEGVDQISTYPMFSFPYSDLGKERRLKSVSRPDSHLIRRLLRLTDQYATKYGMERCAVWSWIKPDKRKFSSITRHHYVGFGPSAASMTGTHFYVNTFDVNAYASALPRRSPVALSMEVDRRLEMAYWLYWRTYELRVVDSDFRALFGDDQAIEDVFWPLLGPSRLLGMLEERDGEYRITKSGAYWIHRLQNEYSLSYINRLWGLCRREPWPGEATL